MSSQYTEIWMPIPDTNHEVSNCGNARNRFSKRPLKWRIMTDRDGYNSVCIRPQNGQKRYFLRLGRLMLSVFEDLDYYDYTWQCDHFDRDTLNNHLSNLKPRTRRENAENKGLYKNNRSGERGVYWCKSKGKWCAQLVMNRKKKHLGVFTNIVDARNAFAQACQKYRNPEVCYDSSHFEVKHQ